MLSTNSLKVVLNPIGPKMFRLPRTYHTVSKYQYYRRVLNGQEFLLMGYSLIPAVYGSMKHDLQQSHWKSINVYYPYAIPQQFPVLGSEAQTIFPLLLAILFLR